MQPEPIVNWIRTKFRDRYDWISFAEKFGFPITFLRNWSYLRCCDFVRSNVTGRKFDQMKKYVKPNYHNRQSDKTNDDEMNHSDYHHDKRKYKEECECKNQKCICLYTVNFEPFGIEFEVVQDKKEIIENEPVIKKPKSGIFDILRDYDQLRSLRITEKTGFLTKNPKTKEMLNRYSFDQRRKIIIQISLLTGTFRLYNNLYTTIDLTVKEEALMLMIMNGQFQDLPMQCAREVAENFRPDEISDNDEDEALYAIYYKSIRIHFEKFNLRIFNELHVRYR